MANLMFDAPPLIHKALRAFCEFNEIADRVACVKRLYWIALDAGVHEDGRARSEKLIQNLEAEMLEASDQAVGYVTRALEVLRKVRSVRERWCAPDPYADDDEHRCCVEGANDLEQINDAIARTKKRVRFGIFSAERNAQLVQKIALKWDLAPSASSVRHAAA